MAPRAQWLHSYVTDDKIYCVYVAPNAELIQEHARVADILAQSLEDGMRTLKQDGMEKCLAGITHIKEVRSVCIK